MIRYRENSHKWQRKFLYLLEYSSAQLQKIRDLLEVEYRQFKEKHYDKDFRQFDQLRQLSDAEYEKFNFGPI